MDRDRFVIVRVGALDDLCALIDQASDDLDHLLSEAIRGALAEIRESLILDPVS